MENQNRFYIYVLCLSIAAYTSAFRLTTSSDRATAGREFNFTCSNFYPNYNTLVNIFRYNESQCMAYVTDDGRCLYILNHTIGYTCICYYNSSIILTVPGTFDMDKLNGSRWTCGSQIQDEVSNPVQVYVEIPITKVDLTSMFSDENPIKVVSGSKHLFMCTSNASQPASRIQWYLSGTNIPDEASDQSSMCSNGCETVISSSVLSYIGNITDNGKTLYCTALNGEGQSVMSTMKSIDILYQPRISDIPDYNVTEGNTLSIFPIIDANPQPTFFLWSRRDENDIVYNGSNLTISNMQRNYSGNYTFLVMNTLKPSGMSSHEGKSWKMFHVNVQYQPVISDIQDYNVTEGNTLGIFPIIDANPQPTLFCWSRRDEREVGNISTNSYLIISNIKRKFSGNYTFLIRSTLTPSGMPSEERISKKTFHVEVQYQPFFSEMEDHNVTEGNDLQIYPVIDANPQPTVLWWTRQNEFIYYGSNLTIKNIQRNSSGNYTCHVMNTLTPSGKSPQNRTSQKTFYVNVQYQPAISDIPDYNVIEGNTLSIFPIIDANPRPTLIWWSFLDENVLHVYIGSNLIISNIQRNFSGIYTLSVMNTLTPSGMPSQERTSRKICVVNVQYQPVISEIQDYNVTEGKYLHIYSIIDANPQPSLAWWTRHNDFIYYGNNLTITNIQRNSSGNYICNVMNTLTPLGKSPQNRTSQKMFYVNVQYQPIIAEINDINITEGSSLAIYPVIDANPKSTSVWWSRQTEPDFKFYDTNFTISNIQRKSSGSYIFNAVNILAPSGMPPQKKTSQKTCNVNVQYKPVLSGFPDYNIEEGSILTLSPTIDANPSPTYIWWTRENDTSFIYNGVPLIIKNIQQINSGSYIAHVMNTLTPSGMPETNLTSQKVYNINVTVINEPNAQHTSDTSDNSVIIGAGVGTGVIVISILVIGVLIFISRKRQINRRHANSNERVYESTPKGQGLSNREMHVYNDLGNVKGEATHLKKKTDECSYEEIGDVKRIRTDNIYQNMTAPDNESKKHYTEKIIYENLNP